MAADHPGKSEKLGAVMSSITLPLFAHEGHGKGEVAPYDLDTPRKVSPETADHPGKSEKLGAARSERRTTAQPTARGGNCSDRL